MIGLSRLKRAIEDVPTGGMQTGDPKVRLKLCDAQRLEVEFNAIIAERDSALSQNAELVAMVEALGDKLSEVVALLDVDGMTAVQWLLDNCQDIESLLKIEPGQHLRDRDAEVGRAGFVEGVRQMAENEIGWFGHDVDSCANHYAEKVRRGEV